jgi:hypothetical protein
MDDVVIVRDDDPRCSELEADGYLIVGRSWGARLRLAEPPDLTGFERVVAKVEASGIAIQELGASFASALFELESVNNADYPFTPATNQPPPMLSEIQGFWRDGKRVFGALDDGRLVGAVVGAVNDGVRTFTAGGAGANDSSLGLVRSMGFTVEEQWRSYQR